jgi:hypothetical protein
MEGYHGRGCRLRRSYQASFIAPKYINQGGEADELRRRGKKAQ